MMLRCLCLLTLCACLDQYDPSPQWQRFAAERELAHRTYPVLNDDGSLPQVGKQKDPIDVVREKYASLCSSCHGAKGGGDGASAVAYNPRPRNFRDPVWQRDTDDARIITVIKKGGEAVGLSNTMAGFGVQFSDEEIALLVKEIRNFADNK